jgi:hypothetical protein
LVVRKPARKVVLQPAVGRRNKAVSQPGARV